MDTELADMILETADKFRDSPYCFISYILEVANYSSSSQDIGKMQELKDDFLKSIVNWKERNL